jgi:hypothetical protein
MSNGSGLLTKRSAARGHLVSPGPGIAGEIFDLRDDLNKELAPLRALTIEEWPNLAATDDDAIKTSVASAASIQTYTGAALNGAIGGGAISPPRNITIVTSSHGDIDAVGVVIEGRDVNDKVLTETITLTNGGGATDVGNKAFAKITKITVPAQSGTGGTLKFGIGNKIGLTKTIKTRSGLTGLISEIVGGIELAQLVTEEWVNPATADVDGFKTSFATSASIQTITGAALDGVVGQGTIFPPRNVTITSSMHADVDAVAVVVTGEDVYGNVVTDTITTTDGGNTTDAGDVPMSKVTSVVIPAMSGTGGSLQIGFGVLVGFAAPIKFRNTKPMVLAEIEVATPKAFDALAGTYVAPGTNSSINGHVTNGSAPDGSKDYVHTYEALRGTLATAAVGAPHGTYTPPVAPGGAMDVSIVYEYDAAIVP